MDSRIRENDKSIGDPCFGKVPIETWTDLTQVGKMRRNYGDRGEAMDFSVKSLSKHLGILALRIGDLS